VKIQLHIERLVLDGLAISRLQGPLVQAAVERELTRLLTTGGLAHEFRAGGAVPVLCGGNLRIESGTHPREAGKQIAGAVHRSIAGGSEKKHKS
jgi:hypothetical protein